MSFVCIFSQQRKKENPIEKIAPLLVSAPLTSLLSLSSLSISPRSILLSLSPALSSTRTSSLLLPFTSLLSPSSLSHHQHHYYHHHHHHHHHHQNYHHYYQIYLIHHQSILPSFSASLSITPPLGLSSSKSPSPVLPPSSSPLFYIPFNYYYYYYFYSFKKR